MILYDYYLMYLVLDIIETSKKTLLWAGTNKINAMRWHNIKLMNP